MIFPGPVALVAGPGSGKTTRLARRVKHLVEDQGVSPEEIIVITFTREAARNMRERLTPPAPPNLPDVTLPPESHPSLIRTMHSLGDMIVTENTGRLEIKKNYHVLSSPEVRQIIFEDAACLCGEPREFGKECDKQKGTIGEPANDRQATVFSMYQRILTACHTIDFDDQIILANKILTEHPDVREHWQSKAKHLLVDEYQDINRPQLDLIRLLSEGNRSGLFVVGDDDQSIYGFRGAQPDFIRDFTKDFGPEARFEAIPDCWRCQPHVIFGAHGFIETFNPGRLNKPLPDCNRPEGPLIDVHNVPSDSREAEILVRIIEDALNHGEVLVLVPKLEHAEPIKAALSKNGIPYQVQTPRSTDSVRVFSALKIWLANPEDNFVFRELLQFVADSKVLGIPGPGVKLPDTVAAREVALSKLSHLWTEVLDNNKSLRQSLGDQTENDPFYENLNGIVLGLAGSIDGSASDFAEGTLDALRPWKSGKQMLKELAAAALSPQDKQTGGARAARIMTMRYSKGLEADTVIVLGLEEGAFPTYQPGTAEFEEQARLFYVSMTRAKESLHLFHARKRSGRATFAARSHNLKPSPFIGGLPKEHRKVTYHQSAAQRAKKRELMATSGSEGRRNGSPL